MLESLSISVIEDCDIAGRPQDKIIPIYPNHATLNRHMSLQNN